MSSLTAKTPKAKEDAIKGYLERNDSLVEIEPSSDPIKISPEEDVWIVQCPKNMSLKRLKGEKLKFPGKTTLNSIELICEKFASCRRQPIALQLGKIESLPIQGAMVVRENLMKPIKVEKNSDDAVKSIESVPFPEGLVERHPLLGVDYLERLKLRKDVKERLDHCHKIMIEDAKPKIFQIKKECESISVKKEKKKKKLQTSDNELQSVKTKKPKKEPKEEISEDLIWLKDI